MSKQSGTVRLARWSATHPWRAIGLWTLFVVVCFVVGGSAGLQEPSATDSGVGESGRAAVLVDDAGLTPPAVENVLVSAPSGPPDRAAATRAAADLVSRMRALPEVSSVRDAVPSADGGALLVRVELTGEADQADTAVPPLLAVTEQVQRANPGLRVEQAGTGSLTRALDETVARDFRRAEISTVPATLIILVVAFGALIAAGVPLLLGLTAVAAATGLTALASHVLPTGQVVSTIILLIGLAVAIDYSMFYLRREREERAAGRGTVAAVEAAAATSGRAVVVSGVAVVVAMASLYLVGDSTFSSIATGAIIVVAVSVLGSVTVLPAVLAKLGRWVDRPRVPGLWRLANRQGPARFWPAVLRPALRHPAAALLVSVLALGALAVPALSLRLAMPGVEDLPRSLPVVQTLDRMRAAFPSTGTVHEVVVRAPAGQAAAVRTALDELTRRTAAEPLFAPDAAAQPRVSADGTVTALPVAVPFGSRSDEASDALARLRSIVPATVGTLPGVQHAVGGEVAAAEDYAGHVRGKLPLVIGFVFLVTFAVMTFAFGSVVAAATCIVLNALSVGAAYGLLVLVFQNSWAQGLLGFTSIGGIVSWIPLFLFVVLFGLSMDYHVFVVSRIREEAAAGVPTRDAVGRGITSSAGVVTSAALVMVAVFSIFATLSTIDMKQIGVGLAAAILIDVTVVRAVLLPAAMVLLGRANWWAPAFLRRRDPVPSVEAVGTAAVEQTRTPVA